MYVYTRRLQKRSFDRARTLPHCRLKITRSRPLLVTGTCPRARKHVHIRIHTHTYSYLYIRTHRCKRISFLAREESRALWSKKVRIYGEEKLTQKVTTVLLSFLHDSSSERFRCLCVCMRVYVWARYFYPSR